MQWRLWCDVNNAQCGVGRFYECCTMGWARTGSTEELCFKLFFELKRGKRLFLMLGFLPSQPSVWNIRRRKRPVAQCRKRQTCFFVVVESSRWDEHTDPWLRVYTQSTFFGWVADFRHRHTARVCLRPNGDAMSIIPIMSLSGFELEGFYQWYDYSPAWAELALPGED